MISVSGQIGSTFTIQLAPVPPDGVVDPGSIKFITDVPADVAVAQSPDGLSATVTMQQAGVCNISVQATSLGNQISGDNVVQDTITPPPPKPATALHVTVGPVTPPAA